MPSFEKDAQVTWLDLTDEELAKIVSPSACMYGKKVKTVETS